MKRSAAILLSGVMFIPLVALGAELYNPIGTTSLTQFLTTLLRLVAQIAFPVIVLFLVYVGFLFITAQGNPEKLKEARNYFLWAIVGALLVLGAHALALAIEETVSRL